jgi:hypothetical protein
MRDVELGVGVALLLLTAIGSAPALVAFGGRRGGLVALATAPVIGFALSALVGSLLILLDQPVDTWAGTWAWGSAAVSIGLSVVLVARSRAIRSELQLPSLTAYAVVLLVGTWLVTRPIAVGGLSFTILRGNGTDAFNYLTTASYLQRTPLSWVLKASLQQMVDRNLSYELARELFSQRWATSALLAWTAWVVHVPLVRFEFGFSVLSMLLAFGPVAVLALELGASLGVALLVALVTVVGFWAQLVVDMRAQSEANAIALVALCVLLWIGLLGSVWRWTWACTLVFGLTFAALMLVYVEITPTLVGGLVLGTLLLRPSRAGLASVARPALATVAVALVLAAPFWGQLVPFLRSQATSAIDFKNDWNQAYFWWLYSNPVRGAWGMIQVAANGAQPDPVQGFWSQAVLVLGVVLTLALGWAGVSAVRQRPRAPALAIVTGVALASLLEAAILMLRGQFWAGGKAISYGYPFLLLALVGVWLVSVHWRPLRWPRAFKLAVQAAVLSWLGIQCALAVYRGASAEQQKGDLGYIAHHGEYRKDAWEVGAIAQALAAHPGADVWLVEPNSWVAEYLNFALGDDAHLIDLYGVRDRRGGVVARQSLTDDPAYLLLDRRTWRNQAQFDGSVVAQTEQFALVKPSFAPGQAPPIVDVAGPGARTATDRTSTLVWLGGSAANWKLVALQAGDVELRWTDRGDTSATSTPIQLSVSPGGDQESSLLGPDQPRVVFPVQRGLNEVKLQLVGGATAANQPIAVGIGSLTDGSEEPAGGGES